MLKRHASTASLALTGSLLLFVGACDTISSDLDAFTETFNPPTPAQAAAWAVDTTNPENQRRGIALLASAPWGGAQPYQQLYRLYIEEPTDPLVKSFALRALGRHGDANDAPLVAKQLESPFRLVRLEAAKALQRLHDPTVADPMWKKLVDQTEESEIRAELAVALGQYPTDAVFQALIAALDHRELAVNLAALDSLQTMTGKDFGLNQAEWIAWRGQGGAQAPSAAIFRTDERFMYPVFRRPKGVMDYILFWVPLTFEDPGLPIGTPSTGVRRTYEGEEQPAPEFQLPVIEKTPEAPAVSPGPAPAPTTGGAAAPRSGSPR